MSRSAICSGDFEVITAEDGEKGCEKAVSERPDIILMDLQMPVMDGWEAARRLKSIPETSDIPIIGLSAHALAGERDKALGEGCDEFDTKPIEFERLVRRSGGFARCNWLERPVDPERSRKSSVSAFVLLANGTAVRC